MMMKTATKMNMVMIMMMMTAFFRVRSERNTKTKSQIAHLSIHKFRRISHNLRQVFVPIFRGILPLSLAIYLCNGYLSHFPHCEITWALFNKLFTICLLILCLIQLKNYYVMCRVLLSSKNSSFIWAGVFRNF